MLANRHQRPTGLKRSNDSGDGYTRMMGAWADDAFGNDPACEWLATFLEQPTAEAVVAQIERVFETQPAIEVDDACVALVASEIVARSQGRWGRSCAESAGVDAWVRDHKPQFTLKDHDQAVHAIDLILGESSELAQEWNHDPQWRASVLELRGRVIR